jgi:hypothetical protein
VWHERYRTARGSRVPRHTRRAVDDGRGESGPGATMVAMPAPPTDPPAAWLRARVLALRTHTRCRVFPGSVEVVPADLAADGAPAAAWEYGGEPGDHALRVDVLVRLLTDCRCRGLRRVHVVHVRAGPHEPGDLDLGWAAAASVAGEVSGTDVAGVLMVSRWGWCDLRTGAGRTWVRLRSR